MIQIMMDQGMIEDWHQGIFFSLVDGLITLSSKKQYIIDLSTIEVEHMAMIATSTYLL